MPHGNSLPWFFPLQPVSSCRSGQLWHLVPLQLPHLPHHAGGQLVLDALVVPGLQVSPRPCQRGRGSPHPRSLHEPWRAPLGEHRGLGGEAGTVSSGCSKRPGALRFTPSSTVNCP